MGDPMWMMLLWKQIGTNAGGNNVDIKLFKVNRFGHVFPLSLEAGVIRIYKNDRAVQKKREISQ